MIEIQDKLIKDLIPCLFFWTRSVEQRGSEDEDAYIRLLSWARGRRRSAWLDELTTGKPRRGRGAGVASVPWCPAAAMLPPLCSSVIPSMARCGSRNAAPPRTPKARQNFHCVLASFSWKLHPTCIAHGLGQLGQWGCLLLAQGGCTKGGNLLLTK